MSLKKKFVPLATVLVLGVSSFGIANAAISEDFKHPIPMMEQKPQQQVPVKIETVKADAKNDADNTRATTASYVYMEDMAKDMAKQMDEHMSDVENHPGMVGNMAKMDEHMKDAKHAETMDEHMQDTTHIEMMSSQMSGNREAVTDHMKAPENMKRHMGM